MLFTAVYHDDADAMTKRRSNATNMARRRFEEKRRRLRRRWLKNSRPLARIPWIMKTEQREVCECHAVYLILHSHSTINSLKSWRANAQTRANAWLIFLDEKLLPIFVNQPTTLLSTVHDGSGQPNNRVYSCYILEKLEYSSRVVPLNLRYFTTWLPWHERAWREEWSVRQGTKPALHVLGWAQ